MPGSAGPTRDASDDMRHHTSPAASAASPDFAGPQRARAVEGERNASTCGAREHALCRRQRREIMIGGVRRAAGSRTRGRIPAEPRTEDRTPEHGRRASTLVPAPMLGRQADMGAAGSARTRRLIRSRCSPRRTPRCTRPRAGSGRAAIGRQVAQAERQAPDLDGRELGQLVVPGDVDRHRLRIDDPVRPDTGQIIRGLRSNRGDVVLR